MDSKYTSFEFIRNSSALPRRGEFAHKKDSYGKNNYTYILFLMFIKDVSTRWNSTYLMLEVFLELKGVLLKVEDYLREVESLPRKPQQMPQNTWNNLKKLASTLRINSPPNS